MVAAAPHARLVVVPRAGHLTAIEDPAAVATALGVLLAQQARERGRRSIDSPSWPPAPSTSVGSDGSGVTPSNRAERLPGTVRM